MTIFSKSFKTLGFGALTLAAVACSTELPELDVEEQWTNAMKRQSMYALFPLNEDFMVGDVLLDTRDRPGASNNDAFNVIRIARAPASEVHRVLCQDRDQRIIIGSPDAAGTDAFQDPTSCAANRDGRFRGQIVISPANSSRPGGIRLNTSRIPNLTVARLTQSQLGAANATDGGGLNLGVGRAERISLSINLKDLQSLQIEPTDASNLLQSLIKNPVETPEATLNVMAHQWPEGARAICRGDFKAAEPMKIAIVTRVEYAGGIEYSFGETKETALRAALDILKDERPEGEVPEFDNFGNVSDGSDEARRLSSLLQSLPSGTPPPGSAGGKLSLGIGTSGNASLNETFPRLLAVGAGSRMTFEAERALLPKNPMELGATVTRCAQLLGIKWSAIDRVDYCEPGVKTHPGLQDITNWLCSRPSYGRSFVEPK